MNRVTCVVREYRIAGRVVAQRALPYLSAAPGATADAPPHERTTMTATLSGNHAENLKARGKLARRRATGNIHVAQMFVEGLAQLEDGTTAEFAPGDYLAHDSEQNRTYVIREADFERDYVLQKIGAQKPRAARVKGDVAVNDAQFAEARAAE